MNNPSQLSSTETAVAARIGATLSALSAALFQNGLTAGHRTMLLAMIRRLIKFGGTMMNDTTTPLLDPSPRGQRSSRRF